MNRIVCDTPVGRLCVTESGGAITGLGWGDVAEVAETPLLAEARRQIAAYFHGDLRDFDLPLRVEASDFQRAVCDAMRAIPYGETRTYGEIAEALGASAQAVGVKVSAQAVGNACGGNPIAVLIPCHRVLGAASLGGYSGAGGIETKVALLKLEGAAGLLI